MGKLSKILSVTIVSTLVLFSAAFAKVEITTKGDMTHYQVRVEGVDFEKVELEKNNFLKASLKGVSGHQAVMHQVGFPEIPSVAFYVHAQNKKDIVVSIDEAKMEKSRQQLANPIAPAQESLPKIRGASAPFAMNRAAYQTSSFMPLLKYRIDEAGTVNGSKQFLVTVYPFSYNPKTGQYKLSNRFDVQVRNAEVISRSSVETFVFIIGQKYKNNSSLNRYMQFKKELGYQVKQIVVGEDANTPEEIRAAIQAIYKTPGANLKHALIVGDIEDVPARKAKTLSSTTMVTDHFYRAIDLANYEEDYNGPDIGVGRITVKNDSELDGVIAKFFKYQLGEFGRTDWFDHVSFLGTDDRWQIAEGTHNYAVEKFFGPKGYTGSFPNANQEGGDKLYAITYKVTKPQVLERINEGRFIINYSGHGATTYWDAPNFGQEDVRNLKDQDVLPFVISNACITGQFNINESYAETWIKHPQGAIMFWGSMDSSYWDEDDVLEKNMYHGIFDNGNRDFATITHHALSEVWKHYAGASRSKYYWETYHIFGDPSIDLRLRAPKTIAISAPDALPYGINNITLTVNDDAGSPVKNARVGITHVEGTYTAVGYTNDAGEVTLELKDAMVAEHYKIVVYGGDIKTTEKLIFMSSPDYPFYILKDFSNSGNQLDIRPGQQFNLNFAAENVSPVASKGGTVVVESLDEGLEIVSGVATVPAVAGGTTVAVNGIVLKASSSVLHENTQNVVLRWTSDEGESFTSNAKVRIIKSELSIVSVDFGDPAHPGDNGFEPNSYGEIFVTLQNTGSFPIENAVLEVNPLDPNFMAEATLTVPFLAPGESIRLETPISIDLHEGTANDQVMPFSISGQSQSPFGTEELVAQSSFVIGKYGYRQVDFSQIGLALADKGTVNFDFSGVGGIKAIKDLTVHVKIQHSYVGDLTLTLFHPNGASVVLRKKIGGSNDDIDEAYGPSALDAFDGLPTEGVWRLEINDSSQSDTGFLNGLKLQFKGFI